MTVSKPCTNTVGFLFNLPATLARLWTKVWYSYTDLHGNATKIPNKNQGRADTGVFITSRTAHVLCAAAHLAAAVFALSKFGEPEIAAASAPIEVKHQYDLWIQLNETRSDQFSPNHLKHRWRTFEEFRGDSHFHAQELTICPIELSDELLGQCAESEFWACDTTSGLPAPIILSLTSTVGATIFEYGYKWLIVSFFLCSFVQHAAAATFYTYYYTSIFAHGRWGWRWLEYAVSASLMSVVITLLTQSPSPDTLYQTATITIFTMACGYLCELADHSLFELQRTHELSMQMNNRLRQKLQNANLYNFATTEWANFQSAVAHAFYKQQTSLQLIALFSCVSGFLLQFFGLWMTPWLARYYNGLTENQASDDIMFTPKLCNSGPPAWVGVAIWTTMLLYTCFGFVMVYRLSYTPKDEQLYYARIWKCETQYCYLSFISKLTLAAVFLYGVTERTKCDVLPNH